MKNRPKNQSEQSKKDKFRSQSGRMPGSDTFGDFNCIHCGNPVSTNELMSGVNNRNHCNYCLWSRHLDHIEAGDRRSVCKGPMRPVGLTVKRTRKKYGAPQGELMLVHRCELCGKLSANRIAADDDLEAVMAVLDNQPQEAVDPSGEIRLLDESARDIVRKQLFGNSETSQAGGDWRETGLDAILSGYDDE